MKILITSTLYPFLQTPWRGTFVRDQVHLLKEEGHDIRVIAPRPWVPLGWERRNPSFRGLRGVKKRMVIDGVMIEAPIFKSMPGGRSPRWVSRQLRRSARKIARKWNDWSPDLVHSHTILPSCHLAVEYARMFDIPVIGTVHGWDFDVGLKLHYNTMRHLIGRLDGLVVVNQRHIEVAERERFKGKIDLIPCPAIIESDPDPEHEISVEERRVSILFPSSVKRPEKDYPLFKSTIKELTSRGWIVETMALGECTRKEVERRMLASDVVLITSERETGPLVAKEAVLLRRRVVSVNVGDLPTWLPSMAISESRETSELSDVIEAAITEPIDSWSIPNEFKSEWTIERLQQFYDEVKSIHSCEM